MRRNFVFDHTHTHTHTHTHIYIYIYHSDTTKMSLKVKKFKLVSRDFFCLIIKVFFCYYQVSLCLIESFCT